MGLIVGIDKVYVRLRVRAYHNSYGNGRVGVRGNRLIFTDETVGSSLVVIDEKGLRSVANLIGDSSFDCVVIGVVIPISKFFLIDNTCEFIAVDFGIPILFDIRFVVGYETATAVNAFVVNGRRKTFNDNVVSV